MNPCCHDNAVQMRGMMHGIIWRARIYVRGGDGDANAYYALGHVCGSLEL